MTRKVAVFVLIAVSIAFFAANAAYAQWTPMNPVRSVQQQADGVLFSMGTGTLKLQVCSDSIVRVLYSATASFPKRPDYVIIKESWPATKFDVQNTDDAVVLITSQLKITVTRKDGAITYADANGNALVQRSEEHTSELQSLRHLVCRLL